jgi:hypothetical protein
MCENFKETGNISGSEHKTEEKYILNTLFWGRSTYDTELTDGLHNFLLILKNLGEHLKANVTKPPKAMISKGKYPVHL